MCGKQNESFCVVKKIKVYFYVTHSSLQHVLPNKEIQCLSQQIPNNHNKGKGTTKQMSILNVRKHLLYVFVSVNETTICSPDILDLSYIITFFLHAIVVLQYNSILYGLLLIGNIYNSVH